MENIDNIIINRLGEHQRKVDFIKRNVSTHSSHTFNIRKFTYTLVCAAACVALFFVISPFLSKNNSVSDISVSSPSFSEFRGAGVKEIETLLSSGQNEEALTVVNKELDELYTEVNSLSTAEMSEEENTYMSSLYSMEIEELMWTKIYLLLKLNKAAELKDACKNYLNNSTFTAHKSEVEKILKKIQ